MSGSIRNVATPTDLLSVVASLNDDWPDTTGAVRTRMDHLPMLVDGSTRSTYLASLLDDVYVRAQGQRLSLSQSAATAAEHAGSWRLGLSLISESARLRWLQLNDLLRLERQHERVRHSILERPVLTPTDASSTTTKSTIDSDLHMAADEWAVSFAGFASNPETSQSAVTTAFLSAHPEFKGTLSRLIELLADQRSDLGDLITRQAALLVNLASDQKQQISVRREAIRRGEEYWENVAITLVSFGVLVGAVAVWSTRVLSSSRHLPLTASPVLTSTTWAILALLLGAGGSSAFVFRSADMPVFSGSATRKYTRNSKVFVSLLIITIVFYMITGGVLFFHANDLVLAAVFGPVLIGLAVIAAAALLLLHGPRDLKEAADEAGDVISDVDLPESGGPTGGRYSSTLQRLSNISDRSHQAFSRESIRWRRLALWLGIPATILTSLGAATGFTSLTEQGPGKYVLASLALIGATLTGVATSLGATGKAESASSTAASFEALSQEIKLSRRVDLSRWKPDDKRRALEDFMNRINVLGGVKDQTSYFSRTHPISPPTASPAAAPAETPAKQVLPPIADALESDGPTI